jgi:hypothetical protein
MSIGWARLRDLPVDIAAPALGGSRRRHPYDERMTSELIVKLAPTAEPDRIRTHANGLGVELSRLHPGTSDPELASYLVARVDPEGARGVAERLMRFDGVESAYVKPGGAPPERSTDGVTP